MPAYDLSAGRRRRIAAWQITVNNSSAVKLLGPNNARVAFLVSASTPADLYLSTVAPLTSLYPLLLLSHSIYPIRFSIEDYGELVWGPIYIQSYDTATQAYVVEVIDTTLFNTNPSLGSIGG